MKDAIHIDNWERIKEIFATVIDEPLELRRAKAAELCDGDERLRSEIDSWLDSYEEADQFLESPAARPPDVSARRVEGRTFGHYTIEREIGRGGMGAVYIANRSDGEFEQKVALKIVRQSIAEDHVIERFRRERQILASLNHPNIAKLLDGGVSEKGEPYLVMEYVDGHPISEYVVSADLSIDDRLRLFLKVCAGLSYAHHNLVVHRDIKPDNILVTADGEPKLLDFGLAKLVDESLGIDLNQTQTAYRALTPAYASPEQMRGEQITTASDVYSLGIVFYELLTGARPLEFQGKGLDEIVRVIETVDPVPPSEKCGSELSAELRGDLDNIALMAVRREPERRYRTIEAFASDIDLHLNDLPISARPSTFRYAAGKFMSRHRIGVVVAALFLLLTVVGVIATISQADRARREKERAESISTFLVGVLRYSDPKLNALRKSGNDTTINEALDEGVRRIEAGGFDDQPEAKAELAQTIGTIYASQGKYIEARRMIELYVRYVRENYPENDPRTVAGMNLWAGLLFDKGDLAEAEVLFRQYIPLLREQYRSGSVGPEVMSESLNNFAYLRRTQGDSREAEMLFRESLALMPQMLADGWKRVATTRSTLASVLADQGRFAEALATSREAVEEFRDRGDTDSPNFGFALTVLGGFQTEKGDYVPADASLREAGHIFAKYVSPTSLWLADNLRNRAINAYFQGRYPDAIQNAGEARRIYEVSFGKHYDQYPTALIYKGLSLVKTGRGEEGEAVVREAYEIRLKSLPREHFWFAIAESALGECLMLRNKADEAAPLLRESVASLERSQGADNPRTVLARSRLNQFLNK